MAMTDLTVGVLLVFMLMLAYFAIISKQDVVDQSIYEKVIEERNQARIAIIDLKQQLEELTKNKQTITQERDAARAKVADLRRRLTELLQYRRTIIQARENIVRSVSRRLEQANISHSADYERGIIRLKADVLFANKSCRYSQRTSNKRSQCYVKSIGRSGTLLYFRSIQ